MIGISVVGYGYWGPNLVRNFYETPGVRLVSVCDLRMARLAGVQSRYPAVEITGDYGELLKDSRVDAVAIATPVSSHFELALMALRGRQTCFRREADCGYGGAGAATDRRSGSARARARGRSHLYTYRRGPQDALAQLRVLSPVLTRRSCTLSNCLGPWWHPPYVRRSSVRKLCSHQALIAAHRPSPRRASSLSLAHAAAKVGLSR